MAFTIGGHLLELLQRFSASSVLSPRVARIGTSAPVHTKMKFTYQQGHAWMTAVQKHQRRAANPWVPAEMPSRIPLDAKNSATFKEAQPELIVPDLAGFYLKPYVDWKATYLDKPELTADRLFEATYGDKARRLVASGKLRPEQAGTVVVDLPDGVADGGK